MAKTRKIPKDLGERIVVDCEHPDGGVFGIEMMTFDDGDEYASIVTRTELEYDAKGQLVYMKGGAPSRKLANTTSDEVAFAAKRVRYIRQLENEDGDPVAFERGRDDKSILAMLKERGTTNLVLDSEGREFVGAPGQKRATEIPKVMRDGKPTDQAIPRAYQREDGAIVLPFEEPLYKWVIREATRIKRERNELLRKNSLPTQ